MRQEESIRLKEAKESWEVAGKVYRATLNAREAAEIAFNQMNSDFKDGSASLTEVLEVQTHLKNTERQLYQAYAGHILAAANYRLASGQDLQGSGK